MEAINYIDNKMETKYISRRPTTVVEYRKKYGRIIEFLIEYFNISMPMSKGYFHMYTNTNIIIEKEDGYCISLELNKYIHNLSKNQDEIEHIK